MGKRGESVFRKMNYCLCNSRATASSSLTEAMREMPEILAIAEIG